MAKFSSRKVQKSGDDDWVGHDIAGDDDWVAVREWAEEVDKVEDEEEARQREEGRWERNRVAVGRRIMYVVGGLGNC